MSERTAIPCSNFKSYSLTAISFASCFTQVRVVYEQGHRRSSARATESTS